MKILPQFALGPYVKVIGADGEVVAYCRMVDTETKEMMLRADSGENVTTGYLRLEWAGPVPQEAIDTCPGEYTALLEAIGSAPEIEAADPLAAIEVAAEPEATGLFARLRRAWTAAAEATSLWMQERARRRRQRRELALLTTMTRRIGRVRGDWSLLLVEISALTESDLYRAFQPIGATPLEREQQVVGAVLRDVVTVDDAQHFVNTGIWRFGAVARAEAHRAEEHRKAEIRARLANAELKTPTAH